ncbi:hypothetical protein Ancab_018799 [Ancistrocladus abbreviatus]
MKKLRGGRRQRDRRGEVLLSCDVSQVVGPVVESRIYDTDSPALSQLPSLQLNPSSFTGSMMGRVKLKIKKLENSNGRHATYSKRKQGILKKAGELSILCDIDLLLVMFSPSGKPSLCCGKQSRIEDVIAKYAQVPAQERARRKLEGLEALEKTFRKLGHSVNVQEFLGTSPSTIKDLTDQVLQLQTRLSEIHRRLSYWSNLDTANDGELLKQMEDSLEGSLQLIQKQKEKFENQQLVTPQNNNQLQTDMHLPFCIIDEQRLPPQSWTPNNDVQHMVLQETNLHTQRNIECPTGSILGGYFGYLDTCNRAEVLVSGKGSGCINDFCGKASQEMEIDGQNPCLSYNLNMLGDKKLQWSVHMNQQGNSLDCGVGNWQPPPAGHDNANHVLDEVSMDSIFELLQCQKASRVPSPLVPAIYKRVVKDPTHIV